MERMEDTASRATVNLRKTREVMKYLKSMYKYICVRKTDFTKNVR